LIYDDLKNLERYRFENENMELARKFLLENDVLDLEKAKHVIKGDEVFMVYHEGIQIPVSEARYEAHEKYVDIHITLAGTNYIRTAEKKNLNNTTVYDVENDFILGDYQGETYTDSFIGKGFFGIYFPEDAHLVNASPNEPHKVEKFVMKVKIEE